MKKLFSDPLHRRGNLFTVNAKMVALLGSTLFAVISFTGCKKESRDLSNNDLKASDNIAARSMGNVVNDYTGLPEQTVWELQQARAATARYRDVKNARSDGYSNINVVVPNMGHHFMKLALVDGTFEIRRPEILVYNPEENGDTTLVAVEYAIPIPLTPNVAPEGFTGSADVWDRNTGFNLWLLHAWVWSYNPAGVFNPTNPLIHLH